MPAPELAAAFLADLFGGSTTESVFLCSLPNARGGSPGEKRLLTRDPVKVEQFVAHWDQPGRSLYFCTGTILAGATPERRGGSPRNKSNIAETPIAWADIDFKGIIDDAPEALAAVQGLMHPPSAIVASGHGLHLYWLLREAAGPTERPRLEALLRSLADLVAGDPAVCETARLMRLPGSTNSKYPGEAIPVEILNAKLERRYELADLEDMCATMPPILTRTPIAREAPNPWLAIAESFGFKPPIDVETRLAAMRHHGTGDSSLHSTQLAVSASLLNRGTPKAEVVRLLLEATAAAVGEEGKHWNWQRTRCELENMCDTWIPKSTRAREALAESEPEIARATGNGTVINLADRRERPGVPHTKPDTPLHVIVARAVIDAMPAQNKDLIFTHEGGWHYADGLWHFLEPDKLNTHLDREIEKACRGLSMHSNNRLVGEARNYIKRDPDLAHERIEWDAHRMIPTISGLVDPKNGELYPARPAHFATWRVAAHYDPDAECPLWLRMINDTFADRDDRERADTIDVIQEMIGIAMIDGARRQLDKGLILHGNDNSGKSEILYVIAGLFGGNPIAAALSGLEGTHALMPFMHRRPWVLHEAFQVGQWHLSAIVKSIVTHDPIGINIKSGPLLTRIARCPIFWGTNYAPQFRETTRAITSRFHVVACKRRFREDEEIGIMQETTKAGFERAAQYVLDREAPGILAWAIRGLQSAVKRGHLKPTSEMLEAGEEIRRDANLVSGFVNDFVEFDPHCMIKTQDFYPAFVVWWTQTKGENRFRPSQYSVGKALAAYGDARIAIDPELRDNSRRYYAGIKLSEDGLRFWEIGITEDRYEARGAFSTPIGGAVNMSIPGTWDGLKSIRKMREEHDATLRSVTDAKVTDRHQGSSVTGSVTGSVTEPQSLDISNNIPF